MMSDAYTIGAIVELAFGADHGSDSERIQRIQDTLEQSCPETVQWCMNGWREEASS